MADERDRRMYLREFVLYRLTARPLDESWEDTINAFLAARQPPGEPAKTSEEYMAEADRAMAAEAHYLTEHADCIDEGCACAANDCPVGKSQATPPAPQPTCEHGRPAGGLCGETDNASTPPCRVHSRRNCPMCPQTAPPAPQSFLASRNSPFISALPLQPLPPPAPLLHREHGQMSQDTPPAPQRFWAVGPTFAPADHWLCVMVYSDGTYSQYGVPRKTRADAEADGAASGLPPWPGASR